MSTLSKGEIAVLKVMLRAAELDYIVSRPITEGTRYDLIIDDGSGLHRVQVKYANGRQAHSVGSVHLHLSNPSRSRKAQRKSYQDEIDVLAVYLPSLDKVCWLKRELWAGKHDISIRYAPARNGQTEGCLVASKHFW